MGWPAWLVAAPLRSGMKAGSSRHLVFGLTLLQSSLQGRGCTSLTWCSTLCWLQAEIFKCSQRFKGWQSRRPQGNLGTAQPGWDPGSDGLARSHPAP